jgi:predicted nucleic acid-binding protein
MALAEIPSGSSVFVDANIFIYHFAGHSQDCTDFLRRIEAGELQGLTGQVSLLEVAHRLMMLEAAGRGPAIRGGPAANMAKRPDLVRQLSKYYFSVRAIPEFGVQVLPLPPDFLMASQEFRQAHGLLVNDSLVPMYMRQAGLSLLASGDAAFDTVTGIRRFAPGDI